MDSKKRQELIKAIESGQYRPTNPVFKVGVIALILSAAAAIFFASADPYASSGDMFASFSTKKALLISAPFVVAILIVIIKHSVNPAKVSSRDRWLIQNGELIEAHIDSFDQLGDLYSLVCSAKYAGEERKFRASITDIRIIPTSSRKIGVFINPSDPKQYFVNIYEHIPLAGGQTLLDRSEMRVEPKARGDLSKTIQMSILAAVCALILFPVILSTDTSSLNLAIMVGVILLTLIAFVGAIYHDYNKNKKILHGGNYIEATVESYYTYRDRRGALHHGISARYIEPSTKRAHEFAASGSSVIKTLQGAKIKVYINPDNMSEYIMDIDGALQDLGFTSARDV